VTAPFARLNEHRVTSARVIVGARGPWVAHVELEGEPDVSGRATLYLGDAALVGTITRTDTFGGVRKLRLVAGGGGWGATLAAKDYHNDAGVQARVVAQDAATAAGETLATFAPAAARLGADYVRNAVRASRALEDAAGGALWYVDYDGHTYVGARAGSAPSADAYEVQEYDLELRRLTLAVDVADAIKVGATLSERLTAPAVVCELEIHVTPDALRVEAYVAPAGAADGALASAWRAAVERVTDRRLYGKYRYRVVSMSVDRVEVQAVRKGAGLPDLLPVSMWPGVAGCHATLAPGAEVLVEFIEGDRSLPIVTHFAGKDGTGFAPIALVIGGTTGPFAARVGDAVSVTLPAGAYPGGTTVAGVITGGSTKVRVA